MIKNIYIKYKYLFVFLSILFLFIIFSIIYTTVYYYNLEKKANFKIYQDIPYVDNPKDVNYNINYTSLNIYVPKDKPDKKMPVIIFVHGGAWTDFFGNKNNYRDYLLKGIYFTDQNYVFVNINYRVFPEYKFPVYVQDVSKAIAWVYDNINIYSGDRDLIFLGGHSAGAQIISLISTDESYLKKNNMDLSVIKGSILLEGIGYDLLKSREFDVDSQIVSKYLMFTFSENDSFLKEASAINHINENTNIPPIILFSAENSILRIGKIEALDFYLKLINSDHYAEYYIIPKRNHGNLNGSFGEEGDLTTIKTQSFLNSIINNKIKR
jgi:acetyl esterase/lipase